MKVGGLLGPRVLLIPELFAFYLPMAPKTVYIALLSQKKRLIIRLSLSVNSTFIKLLPIIQISVLFVELGANGKPQVILKVPYQEVFLKGNGGIKFFLKNLVNTLSMQLNLLLLPVDINWSFGISFRCYL